MQCTVHFIITLFNVGNVLLCVIYQLNFTVFKYVTRIPCYITLYIAFGIIRSRSWNILLVDRGVGLYFQGVRLYGIEEYNDKWMMNRKIFGRNRLWPNLKYSLTIFHKISLTRARPLSQDNLPDMKPDLQPSNHDVQLLYLIHFLTLPV